MSAKATFWAWEQQLNHSTKIVLLSLANYSNDDDESWHGMESLSKACGLSKRSIINHLKKLEGSGLLSIIRRKKSGVLNDTNVYKLHINVTVPGEVSAPGQVNDVHHPSERDSLPLVKEIHYPGERRAPKSKKNLKDKTKSKLKEADVDAPDYIDQETLNEYLAWRKSQKLSNSQRVITRLINKLKSFEDGSQGDGQMALENALTNGWKDVYAPDNNAGCSNIRRRAATQRKLDVFEQVEREEKECALRAPQAHLSDPFNSGFGSGVTIDG